MTEKILLNEQIIPRYIRPAMLVTLLGVLLCFSIISIILNYHWKQYGIDTKRLAQIRRLYFAVSAILLITLVALLLITP